MKKASWTFIQNKAEEIRFLLLSAVPVIILDSLLIRREQRLHSEENVFFQ